MKNSQKHTEFLAIVALAVASATAAHAQVIASDNFSEGTVGSEILGAGAAGNGWANAWADKNAFDSVQSGSLSYTDGDGNPLTTSGNSLYSPGGNPSTSSSEPQRTLSTTIGADALANSANPDTVWMSYLWEGGNPVNANGYYRQATLMFLKGASATSTTATGTEYADIGMPNISSANVSTVNPNISMFFSSGNVGSSIPSTAPLQSTWSALSTTPYFILVEMTGTATAWATTGGSETINVWVDPLLTGTTPTEPADISYTGQDLSGINGIRLQGGGYNATYGGNGVETAADINLGDTVGDVEPGFVNAPEPTTLALSALGGLGLLFFRRKS